MASTIRNIHPRTAPKPKVSLAGVIPKLQQWQGLRNQSALLDVRVGSLKGDLMKVIEEVGVEDNDGHLWLELPEAIEVEHISVDKKTNEPKYGKKLYTKLKREKRISEPLDEDKAEAILAKKNLLDQCQTIITVLDEEKIQALYFQKKITKAELRQMFPQRVTWAFIPN
jgi:hypothetical protein